MEQVGLRYRYLNGAMEHTDKRGTQAIDGTEANVLHKSSSTPCIQHCQIRKEAQASPLEFLLLHIEYNNFMHTTNTCIHS